LETAVRRLPSIALLLGTLAVAACSPQVTQPRTTLPPANAQPGEVVAAYLQALVDGDCAKARALSTNGGQAPFCDRPRVTAYSELSRGNGAHPNPTEVVYAVELTIRGGDVSLPDGKHTMFVQVLLQPGGVWRVNGVGSGP
jgi:hypothetical protein